jgi:hypothetical protein
LRTYPIGASGGFDRFIAFEQFLQSLSPAGSQKQMDPSHGEAAGFTRGPGAGASSDPADEDEKKRIKARSHDNDCSLE